MSSSNNVFNGIRIAFHWNPMAVGHINFFKRIAKDISAVEISVVIKFLASR